MAECSSLLQLRASFGRFKTLVSEQLNRVNAMKVAQYSGLTKLQCNKIYEAENPGLVLLTILEDEEHIGHNIGIDHLLKALEYLKLDGISSIASNHYEEKLIDKMDTEDGPVFIEKGLLTSCLRDELTQQNCYELATYFGLPPKICEDIRKAPLPADLLLTSLIEHLVIVNSGDSINASSFVSALKENKLGRVATLVLCASSSGATKDMILEEDEKTLAKTDELIGILRDELSRRNCHDIATYFGLSWKVCEDVRASQTPVEDLIRHLGDGGLASDSNVDVLELVLNAIDLNHVASLLSSGNGGVSGESSEENSDGVFTKALRKCMCDRENFEEFRSLENELIFIQCRHCSTEWLLEQDSITRKSPISMIRGRQRFWYKPPIFCDFDSIRREKIQNADELRQGDHVVIPGVIEHNTIVISITDGKIEVIHWTRNKRHSLMKNIITKKLGKAYHIAKELIEFPKDGVFRVQYDSEDPPKIVLARAMKMMRKSNQTYCVLDNNCETLATYCKIGKGFSKQGDLVNDVLPPVMTWFLKSLH